MACRELRKNIHVSISWREYADIRTTHERRNPLGRLREGQWPPKHLVVRAHAQELVDDIPCHIPTPVVVTPGLDERVRLLMLIGVGIHGVQQQIGVDDKHGLRAVHGVVQRVAVGDIHTRLTHPMRRQSGKIESRRRLQPARERLGHDLRQRRSAFRSSSLEGANQVVRKHKRSLHTDNHTTGTRLRQVSLGAERFLAEIRTTANLQHRHILPLHDSGEVDGVLYYVMPFVKGEPLRDRLNRETRLSVHDAIRIVQEVADALDYAHRAGIVHRDIKPESILSPAHRSMAAAICTAWGCILYECLTGELPFNGNAMAIIAIMRTFVQLRRLMDSNREPAWKIDALEARYDEQFAMVFDAIKRLIADEDAVEIPLERRIGFTP